MDERWKRNAEGLVILNPLTGFQVQTGAQMHLLLLLNYFRPEDPLDQEPKGHLQLVFSPSMARQLAADLLVEADEIETRPGQGRPN